MAGFLRKKSKQNPQSKSSSTQSLPPSSQTTPLFARFASASRPAQEAPLIVSSPMMLSSARRDAAGPLYQNRGSRTATQAAVQSQRDAETRTQRVQSNGAGKARDIETESGNRVPAPRQHSPTQVRVRPVSRVPMFDKPLPPSFQLDPSNPNPISLSPVLSLPLSAEHPSPVQGEYAHLWSIIAGVDTQLPEPVELPSTNPLAVPEKTHEVTEKQASRSHHTTSNVTSPPDLASPISRPPPAHAGFNPLPKPPSGARLPTPPIASSYGHSPIFDEPDHPFRTETLAARPSNHSPSRQESLADDSTLRSDTGVSTSRTTLLSDDVQYDGLTTDVFGPRPMKSSHELPSSRQGPHTPDISSNEGLDTASSPSPSGSPKAHRKLSKVKHKGPLSTSSPSRLSVAFEEKPVNFAQPYPNFDGVHGSYQSLDTMGANFSAPDVSALQQSFNGIPSQDILGNNQRRNVSPPPQAQVSSQQRTSVSYTPTTPPRKSSSMRSTNGPIVTGKPLIFTAMAAVDEVGPQAPLSPSQAAQPLGQNKIWSNTATPPQQRWLNAVPPPPTHYPSQPAETARPVRKESLQVRNPPHHGQHGPPPPVMNNVSHSQSVTSFTYQAPPQPAPAPKATHAPHMNGNLPPLPLSEQPVTPRVRRLSKARAPPQSSADFPSSSRTSTATTTPATSGLHQRTPVKVRPTTPISPGRAGPIQIESDVLGVPLDDDPFAKVDGVKMLKPFSRPASPTGTSDGTGTGGRRLKSRDGRKGSGGEEMLSDGSQGERTRPGSQPSANVDASQEQMPVEHGRHVNGGDREMEMGLQTVTPPIIDGTEGAQDYLTGFLADPQLLATLLGFLTFYDWCLVLSLSRDIRFMIVQNPILRETVLERFLKTVGYTRWAWNERDPLSLSLQDLNDYMRGVSTPTHEYARVAALYVHSLSIHPAHRDQSLYDTVHHLAASTRAYSRVVLRLRAQAEKEAAVGRSRGTTRAGSRPPSRAPSPTFSQSNHSYTSAHTPQPPQARAATASFQSPLFRLKRAPLLRVFVPSPDGDWLSDKSVLECEGECRRAGLMGLMRIGDVVWDVAVGDEGNVGRLVWDGSYLIDLDYTYSPVGDLPKYMPTLAFPPSYFHRVIRTGPNSSNPIAHIDLRPWGEEIAANLQLLQDRVRTETPQGAYHNVVRWVHRSSFVIRPPARGTSRSPTQYSQHRTVPQTVPPRIPIPESNMFVDPGWYGTIVVETEGTNESLADLQDRCGPGAFPARPPGVNGPKTSTMLREGKVVFRILREKSRPGEIWIRTVSPKERLL